MENLFFVWKHDLCLRKELIFFIIRDPRGCTTLFFVYFILRTMLFMLCFNYVSYTFTYFV